MNEFTTTGFTELALQLGIAVLLFGALIIFSIIVRRWINSDQTKWATELKLREQKDQADKEMLTSLIEKNYTILTSVMTDSREQIHVITRLVERIKTMQTSYDQAFHDLFTKHDGHDRDRCIHHINQEFKHS